MLGHFRHFRQFGFTLIELLVGFVILGLLATVAIPELRGWMLNSQVRNAAESVLDGLQMARNEAVKRNTIVVFELTEGSSWTVNTGDGTLIASRSKKEGSGSVEVTAIPNAATIVTFNSLGGIEPNVPASSSVASIDFTVADGTRPLQINIGAGGQIRMCDPYAKTGSPAAC